MERMITYQSLFQQELFYDDENKVKISSVVVPKIQRPYAQGRMDALSSNVRAKFLSEIFRVLASEQDEILDLNFVYGTVTKQGTDGYVLELLDGQQRITTLFLLHWYLTVRELQEDAAEFKNIMESLSKFSYETRSSSREFCKHLSEYKPVIDKSPTEIIKKARWYYKSYDKDSTISAMLVMLDAIHEEYEKLNGVTLYDKLNRLQFYVLSLGQFDLSEELYVKMNARGLALSGFENFKADLLDYLSADNLPENQLLAFSTKLDTVWIDLFWNKENELFDISYLSFFYRFFAARYILDHVEITPEDIRKDQTLAFLYTNAEKSVEIDYWGFSKFAHEIEYGKSEGIDYVEEITRALDVLLTYKKDIGKFLSPVWSPDEKTDFFYNKTTKFEHTTMIVWAALLEFIRLQKVFDVNILKQWMRIVTNIIENSNIDSLEPTTGIARNLSQLMKFASLRMEEGMSLHEALSGYEFNGVVRRAVNEEVYKCRFIASDTSWEEEFKNAERHPFLKGMIGFYLSDDITIDEFRHRTSIVFSMFDEYGITEEFKKEHILIRAFVSQFTTWGDLINKYITETSDVNKYLKNMIAGTPAIHELFKQVTSLSTINEVVAALKNETEKESEFIYNSSDQFWNRSVPHCYDRLRKDIHLYDWMASVEGKRKCRVYYSNGFISVSTPNAYYDRIVIDCDRAEIIKKLISEYNLSFEDEAQNALESIGEVYCFRVTLNKPYSHGTLNVLFGDEHKLLLSFKMNDKSNLSAYQTVFKDRAIVDDNDSNLIWIGECKYHFIDDTLTEIRATLNEAVDRLNMVVIDEGKAS